MTSGVLAVGVFALLTILLSWIQLALARLRPFIHGIPVVIIEDGQPLFDVLRRERLSANDLFAAAREKGLRRLDRGPARGARGRREDLLHRFATTAPRSFLRWGERCRLRSGPCGGPGGERRARRRRSPARTSGTGRRSTAGERRPGPGRAALGGAAEAAPWAGADVLDVGCGDGFHLPLFAAEAASVIGVEPHPPLVERARRLVGDRARVIEAGAAGCRCRTARSTWCTPAPPTSSARAASRGWPRREGAAARRRDRDHRPGRHRAAVRRVDARRHPALRPAAGRAVLRRAGLLAAPGARPCWRFPDRATCEAVLRMSSPRRWPTGPSRRPGAPPSRSAIGCTSGARASRTGRRRVRRWVNVSAISSVS